MKNCKKCGKIITFHEMYCQLCNDKIKQLLNIDKELKIMFSKMALGGN